MRYLRSIQGQLKQITENFDIECDDRSKPYGYRWLEKAKAIAVPNLTPQESLLLQLAEEHLGNLLPPRLMKSMEGFFTQARQNLGPGSTAHLEKQWQDKVRVVATSQPLLPPKIAANVFDVVSEALYSNRWLDLEYKNSGGTKSVIRVMPLGLAQQGPRLYLVCRYEGYDNERTLAVHRILGAKASTLTFERPKDFNLKQYDDDGRFGFGYGEKVQLKFRIDKDTGQHLTETPLPADQEVVEVGDNLLEITATVIDSAMLEWWLRGFGDDVMDIERYPIQG